MHIDETRRVLEGKIEKSGAKKRNEMLHEINEENDDALSIQTVTVAVIMNRIENPNGNITGMKDSLKIKVSLDNL